MTHDEFKRWVATHVAAFPGILEWGKRVGNWSDVKASWERVLSDVAFDDAARITDLWSKGDLESPKGFGDHARAVRLAAKGFSSKRVKQTRRTIDGTPTYACKDCEDSGVLYVFHPAAMREQEQGILERSYIVQIKRALPVKCDCDAGMALKAEMPPRINRKTMVPMVGSVDAMFDRLAEFIDDWKQRRLENAPNYSPELAE